MYKHLASKCRKLAEQACIMMHHITLFSARPASHNLLLLIWVNVCTSRSRAPGYTTGAVHQAT